MKAAVFQGAGEIEICDVPCPQPGPGEALVRVHYCGICGSDLEAYETGMYEPGMIIGHEMGGEVAALGPGTVGWQVGEQVTVDDVLPCGRCWFCQHGRPVLCSEMVMTGITIPGGMAEFVSLPVQLLYRLPNGVSTRQAALIEPLAVALHGVRSSSMCPGDDVLVMGAGPIGLFTLQCARELGARQVLVSEVEPTRAALALSLGASRVFNPHRENLAVEVRQQTRGLGAKVAFVCTGATEPYGEAINLVQRGGQVFILGVCVESVPADYMSIVLNELTISGGYTGHGAFLEALRLVGAGKVQVDPLISQEIRLDELVEAGFEELRRPGTKAVKILVRPE